MSEEKNNLKTLRDTLFEEIRLLREGKITEKRARITANLAKRIIETSTLELIAVRQLNANSDSDFKRLLDGN